MADQPVCPYCGAKLFPHELSNDECGTCGRRLSTAVGWSPPAPQEPPRRIDEPLFLADRPPPEAFAAVRQGIHLVHWGIVLTLVFASLAALCQVIGASVDEADARFVLALAALGWVFEIVSALVVFLGVCFCCAVPRGCKAARRARPMIACLMAIVPLVLLDAGVLILRAETGSFYDKFLFPAAVFTSPLLLGAVFAGTVCFLLLFADLARFFGEPRLAQHLTTLCSVSVLCGAVVLCAGCVTVPFFTPSATSAKEEAAGAMATGASVVLTIGFAWAAWLLFLLTRLLRVMPVPGEPERPRVFPPPGRWR